ncbi:MAG: LamG domain-containing protein [Armatimonadetes bacterium]|nr:LamG domain-containing protein [Armatimonadota bacterium]
MIATLALLTGATTSAAGFSLHFTGDRQLARIPYQKAFDLPQATIELWFKAESNDRFYNYLLCRNYGDHGWGLALHGRPGKVFSQAPAVAVRPGVWTHLALVFSDKAEKVYIDGGLAAARERGHDHLPFAHDVMVGNSDMTGSPGNEPTPFHGWIDEIRIWSKPLTQAQIRSRMSRALQGTERNLVGYFPFDEGQGQIVHDFTGRLISGCLGDSFEADPADPQWAPGVPLSGRTKMRVRR